MVEPIFVKARTVGEAYEELVPKMMRDGVDIFVEAPDYKTWTKDKPIFVVITEPMSEPRVSPKAPLTPEMYEKYKKEMLEGNPPEIENGFDYTYYSRLRFYPEVLERADVPNLPEGEENITGKIIRLDQVELAIETLRKDPTRRSVVMTTWIVARDSFKFGKREKSSSPCLVIFHPRIVEGKLHMFSYMKTQDLIGGFPGNLYAFTAFQAWMAEQLDVGVGTYTHYVHSAQIYEEMYEWVKETFGLEG